ncbi:glutamine amidotransferase [Saccharomonospora sp. CUA-673]|uniref:DJ-1/PfpI family protein n=1 Tax=Saccharomonospora sp. CUA-673 TaxID=1904969 RepID=UPI00096346C8|nr:DJ-1/PfpI family protein [Saccharomonospora sp. CUA-673]OLT43754.1 glutamine amidotransferase [Saccharomonospora sp. CUA-673]
MPQPRAQFVLYDGFDPLDVVGPYEVLAAGRAAMGGGPDLELVTAEGPRTVQPGTPGLALTATGTLDPSAAGYVVVPGAAGPAEPTPDGGDSIPELLARFANGDAAPLLREAFDNPDITVVGVCGGSLAMAMVGLLAARNAATHVLGRDALAATGANTVRARVVDDGDLISSGGVTSGLDLGLYLLERDFGPRVALAVEELFEHERRGVTWRATGRAPLTAGGPA